LAERSHLTPEVRALISACRVDDRVELATGIDTDLFVKLARFHRVSAFVWERREALGLNEACSNALRAEMLATLHRNLHFAAELKIALTALNDAGVETILLKGAHLMDALYHDPSKRPISDLDLLIRPVDADAALTALRSVGYDADPKTARFGLLADREVALDKKGLHTVITELHTDLNRSTRHHWFPMDALWQRAVPHVVDGQSTRALCLEDNLVYLCAHAVPHAFSQIIWLKDIASLVETGPGWDALVERARESHAVKAVYAALVLSRDLLGASVPESAVSSLNVIGLDEHLDPARLFGGTHYSTIGSLGWRAKLADNAGDALSIVFGSVLHRLGEWRNGIVRRKSRLRM
jgi:hypothetical protein